MATELAPLKMMTSFDYANDDRDEGENGKDGDGNDIVIMPP